MLKLTERRGSSTSLSMKLVKLCRHNQKISTRVSLSLTHISLKLRFAHEYQHKTRKKKLLLQRVNKFFFPIPEFWLF